jgi:ABC-2 type transport system permease protein
MFRAFYLSYVEFKRRFLSYRGRLIFWSISNALNLSFSMFLWISIIKTQFNTSYTVNGILLYLYLSKVIECIQFNGIEESISEDVRKGFLANILVKPIKYSKYIVFRSFGATLGSIIYYVPVYTVVFIIFNFTFADEKILLYNLLLFVLFMILAFVINLLITLCFSTLIFKSITNHGVVSVRRLVISIASGSFIPLDLFPEQIKDILILLPLSYLRYVPIKVLTEDLGSSVVVFYFGVSVSWIMVLLFSYKLLWKRFAANVNVVGV